jgi:acyl-CoA thioesterase-1
MPSASVIVCFGDSLTAGYQSASVEHSGLRETPYGEFLQERLGASVRVVTSGVCGEVTSDMVRRFAHDVVRHAPAYVVILGGTNDLGWNAEPSGIMHNLRTMYEQARASGIVPVAVTVPSIRADTGNDLVVVPWIQDHIARRRLLNQDIITYCEEAAMSCVDLFGATAEPETGHLAEAYSNDGLHLTTMGYRRLADLLYDEVFAHAKIVSH